jgi:uncharacterized membrane protein HdeD (DUF308 family)
MAELLKGANMKNEKVGAAAFAAALLATAFAVCLFIFESSLREAGWEKTTEWSIIVTGLVGVVLGLASLRTRTGSTAVLVGILLAVALVVHFKETYPVLN